ncbi:threonine-phosphate decarboxylase CobD [Elusimicrobiota bacterium]
MAEHGGNLRLAEEKYKLREEEILDFSSNINPLGLPSGVKEAILGTYKNIIRYPDPESKEVKEILSVKMNCPPENILIGNGSIELIYLIVSALKPEKVLIPVPAFSEYEYCSKLMGAECIFVKSKENKSYKPDLNKIVRGIHDTEILFICNPNNPTGTSLHKNELKSILKECKVNNTVMVIDEAFIDFAEDINNTSMSSELKNNPNLLIIRSLTKLFALPGLRIGYLLGNKNLISKISKYQYPWAVSYLAQEAAKSAVKYAGYIEKTREYIFREKKYLFKNLKKIGWLETYDSDSNFILCKIKNREHNSKKLADILGEKGILIRNCSNFRGLNSKHIRIAVKKRKENRILLDSLREVSW